MTYIDALIHPHMIVIMLSFTMFKLPSLIAVRQKSVDLGLRRRFIRMCKSILIFYFVVAPFIVWMIV
jgi:hypothetical protein